jgi:hypothetical protein
MFITEVPAGFNKVDDVRLEGGKLMVEGGGRRVQLTVSASL